MELEDLDNDDLIAWFNNGTGESWTEIVVDANFNGALSINAAGIDGEVTTGEHSISLDGSELEPGVYLLRLRTPISTQTAKCLRVE